ncbi:hypothetical protein JIX56_22290 [Streptomyces sp. CA-210063]|uniref:hypothetical protein n=1 Tax=Streptomyces sp. CA-210063 TaxID=2801029 RepID=UPI00214A963F|nr:hypothetical protein [Streptomyces sp. CA-210063]UUU32411.1 hypothetical protein JIX56_22290 [Streptomyces sp. CA-210063]
MRVAVRRGWVGRAVLLAALLSGCGGAEVPPGATSGPSGAASTAPGVDGEADVERVFTEGELKAALPPAEVLGRGAEVTRTDLGLFGRYGGGEWTSCAAGNGPRVEMRGFEGASAQQTVRLAGAAENSRVVTVQLVSMSAGRAERYLEVRHRLNQACPDVTVDTEAAPVQEHHEAREIAGLGDAALLESTRRTGGDEYDGTPSYAVHVRVGGVLAIVTSGGDKETSITLAARATERVRAELYGVDGAADGASG